MNYELERFWKELSLPNLNSYTHICLEGLGKAVESVSYDSRSPDREVAQVVAIDLIWC
jgi:hypothetical protein